MIYAVIWNIFRIFTPSINQNDYVEKDRSESSVVVVK